MSVVHQAISSVERLWNVETGERPIVALRIRCLVITQQARCDVVGVPDPVERHFLDHEARDNLRLVGDLKPCLLREQLLLTHQEREELDLLPVKCVVDVAKPLIFVLVQALRLVAKEHDNAATGSCSGFADLGGQSHAFRRVPARVRLRVTDRRKEVGKERSFGVARLVLALRMVRRHLRIVSGEQEAYILYRSRLADPRRAVDESARDSIAKATSDEVVEFLDGGRRDTIVTGGQWVNRGIDWPWNFDGHCTPPSFISS
jgi:hypothetical protein